MKYRRLGQSGLKLSVLSLGSWGTFRDQMNPSLAGRLFAAALVQVSKLTPEIITRIEAAAAA